MWVYLLIHTLSIFFFQNSSLCCISSIHSDKSCNMPVVVALNVNASPLKSKLMAPWSSKIALFRLLTILSTCMFLVCFVSSSSFSSSSSSANFFSNSWWYVSKPLMDELAHASKQACRAYTWRNRMSLNVSISASFSFKHRPRLCEPVDVIDKLAVELSDINEPCRRKLVWLP